MRRTLFLIPALLILSPLGLSGAGGLHLLKHFDNKHGSTSGISYSGSWGYVAPNGREYALLGTATGTAIIDITDTSDVYEVSHIAGPTSIWREMRTWKDRLYIVSEGGGGVTIVDLSNLPLSTIVVKNFNYVSGVHNTLRSHTIEIFDGTMYLNGCAGWAPGGVLMFSLADPDNPAFLGEYEPEYIHDCYVRHDTIFGAAIYGGGGLDIASVVDKSSPSQIAKITYPGSGTHNVWTTTDGLYAITTDEIGTTQKSLKFWALQSLPSVPPSPTATFQITPTDIEHNVFVRGGFAYTAWYTAGIVVVDVHDPANPFAAGHYDTSNDTLYPPGNYDGVWAVYPYFWSGKVTAGDMQNGLYIFSFDGLAPRTPVHLQIPPNHITLKDTLPVMFRWTRAADPAVDPHEYVLELKNGTIDTFFAAGTDTFLTLTRPATLGPGPWTWRVITKDEINRIPSVETYTITFPGPAVVAPNGGEIWMTGSVHQISWTSPFVDSVGIDLSRDGGGTWSTIVADTPASLGSVQWTVSGPGTPKALIKITNRANGSYDVSDSDFTIATAAFQASPSWNLVSLPVIPASPLPTDNFPGAHLAHPVVFSYAGYYMAAESLTIGTGYWVKYDSAKTWYGLGTTFDSNVVPLSARWNLIGALSDAVSVSSISVSPPTVTLSPAYGYSPLSGYVMADTLFPGQGYWIKASGAGDLQLKHGTGAQPTSLFRNVMADHLNTITFEDAAGRKRTIRFSAIDGVEPEDIPPIPPTGTFDVRCATQLQSESETGSRQATVLISSARYPIDVTWETHGTGGLTALVVDGQTTLLAGSGSLRLLAPPNSISVGPAASQSRQLPLKTELLQNYPNPFNPSTDIRFRIALASDVRLTIFDVLGRTVATLRHERLEPGEYSSYWDAGAFSGGVYYAKLEAGEGVFVRKLLLVR